MDTIPHSTLFLSLSNIHHQSWIPGFKGVEPQGAFDRDTIHQKLFLTNILIFIIIGDIIDLFFVSV